MTLDVQGTSFPTFGVLRKWNFVYMIIKQIKNYSLYPYLHYISHYWWGDNLFWYVGRYHYCRTKHFVGKRVFQQTFQTLILHLLVKEYFNKYLLKPYGTSWLSNSTLLLIWMDPSSHGLSLISFLTLGNSVHGALFLGSL